MSLLPKEKTNPKKSLGEHTVLFYACPKFGKCVKGTTKVINAKNMALIDIKDLEGTDTEILVLNFAGNIVKSKFTNFSINKSQQLYKVVTQGGRTIEATENHPFLTTEGYKELKTLKVDDRVSVVVDYSKIEYNDFNADKNWVKILAYLIADGSIKGYSPIFTKNEDIIRNEFIEACRAVDCDCVEFDNKGAKNVRVRGVPNGPGHHRNFVMAFIREHCLDGCGAKDKFIPDFVFTMRRSLIGLFLNRLFTCDGSCEKNLISYSSTSFTLMSQIIHLLARLGINCTTRDKYLDGKLYGQELSISQKDDIIKFIKQVGFFGRKQESANILLDKKENTEAKHTQVHREGNIVFDRILSIEPTTIEDTYDIEIPNYHNFIANDFVVHNSTWASQFPNALFIATEPGHNCLSIYKVDIVPSKDKTAWEMFIDVMKELVTTKHDFKTIVIDTIDNLQKMCSEHVCAKLKIGDESELGFGKGFKAVNKELMKVLTRVAMLNMGLILISHAKEKEVDTRTGKIKKNVPNLPDSAAKPIIGMVDMILYGDFQTVFNEEKKPVSQKRVIRTKPAIMYEAGDRTGRLPDTIDFSYEALVKAYNGDKLDVEDSSDEE